MQDRPRDLDDDELRTELEHLLQELRVALPGVQILFAFLLTVPFANRFEHGTPFQEGADLATLIATLAAPACLTGPPSYHRLRFRRHTDPERMPNAANLLVIVGPACLALALTSAIL